jgi:hypothetical protein
MDELIDVYSQQQEPGSAVISSTLSRSSLTCDNIDTVQADLTNLKIYFIKLRLCGIMKFVGRAGCHLKSQTLFVACISNR